MDERRISRNGRTWTIARVSRAEAEEHDFEFWQQMTPEERVAAVADCLLSCLKTRGIDEIPRLRRVHRRVNAHDVRYLIAGAHAVAFHGTPRATKNLDVYVDPEKEVSRAQRCTPGASWPVRSTQRW